MNSKETVKNIGIIGCGVVGSATGTGLAMLGFDVSFYDIHPEKINFHKNNGFKSFHVDKLKNNHDLYFISVDTPNKEGQISFDSLLNSSKSLGKILRESENHPIIVIRSTVPPMTTESIVVPLLEKISEKECGKDFGICINPEFFRERNALDDFMRPWIIVIGSNDGSGKILEKIYAGRIAPLFHLTLKEAEFLKYVHNIWNATKISYFNEMRQVAKNIGIDPGKIFRLAMISAEASWNPQYGIEDRGPFGGNCLPKDTQAFLEWAKNEFGLEMPLLEATIEVNERIKRKLPSLREWE